MKNATKLLSLVLAVFMLLACFVSCGETPAETTKAAETTEKTVTTTKATTTKPVTTKAPITKATTTTGEVTTKADPEPEIAAKEHTTHLWYSTPSFTAYDAKKVDGTIGELATHCRYAGCTAIKEENPIPALIWLDFNNYTGTAAAYLEDPAQQNITSFHKDVSLTSGKVVNGVWTPSWTNTQVMMEDTIGLFLNYNKFTVTYDAQIGAFGALLGVTFFGDNVISIYAGQIRSHDTTDDTPLGTIELCRGTTTALSLDGATIKLKSWYRFEMEYISYPETPGVSTMNVYMTTWELDENGDRTVIDYSSRELLGSISGIPVTDPTDADSQTKYDEYLSNLSKSTYGGFRIGWKGSIKTLDNFSVTVPVKEGEHQHQFGAPETVNFASVTNGYKGYKWAKCSVGTCEYCQVTPILENDTDGAPTVTEFLCTKDACGCRLATVVTTPADCENDEKITTTCVKCGNAIITKGTAEALNHDYKVSKTVAAACGTDGYTIKTCSRCKDTVKELTGAMTNPHSYVKTYVAYTTETKPADSKAIGYYNVTCSTCNYVAKEEVLVKLDFDTLPDPAGTYSADVAAILGTSDGQTNAANITSFLQYIDKADNVSLYNGYKSTDPSYVSFAGGAGVIQDGKLTTPINQLYVVDDMNMLLQSSQIRQFKVTMVAVPGATDSFFMAATRPKDGVPNTWILRLNFVAGTGENADKWELRPSCGSTSGAKAASTGMFLDPTQEYKFEIEFDLDLNVCSIFVDGVRLTAGENYTFKILERTDASEEFLWKFASKKVAGRSYDSFEVSYVPESKN